METTRDTIKKLMSKHTNAGGLICAQSLCGVGGLQNTVSLEDKTGLIDFPISDSSNPAIAVGMSLSKPVVYVIRFAGFGWINYWPIVNYAAKCKELWGYKCQLLVRCMVAEGQIGPVASNANHSIICHMPGIKVFAPMTSQEWKNVWKEYENSDSPIFCSESRKSYDIDYGIYDDLSLTNIDIMFIGIGTARLECQKAQIKLEELGYNTNFINIISLKPLSFSKIQEKCILNSQKIVVIDGDYSICGISEHISYTIMKDYKVPSYALALEDKTAGFATHCDNLTPSTEKIIDFVKCLK